MVYKNGKVEEINIAYIGGGSRNWAWDLMSDLAFEENISGNIKLFDIDFESALNNEKIGNSLTERDDLKGKWNYKAVKKIEEALDGADFVIISIIVGTYKEMEVDVHLPEKYGIYQAVGDTVGPGGLFRALRTLPVYIEFAKMIEKYCPNAWVINYTNPMTLCTRVLYEVFPSIKAFGCCHEVFSTQILLTDVLTEIEGIKKVNREEIKVNVKGINHFTWIDKASYKGIDLLPLYDKFVDKYFENGYFDSRQKRRDKLDAYYFGCYNKVKFDLYKKFGIIAAAGDRHLAEFVPWYIIGNNDELYKKWGFTLTPVSFRITRHNTRNELAKKIANGEAKFEPKKSGEEGVNQIKALVGLGDLVTNVNLPNKGQLEGFPLNAVVETNAFFTKDRLQPVFSGGFREDLKAIILRHVLNQETILKAVINKDKKLAFNAFVNDPLVNIPLSEAKELFNEMFEATKKYLKGW